MKRSLLDILACPSCGSDLDLVAERRDGDEIEEGSLGCRCGATYPIRKGICRFVEGDDYASSFTLEWHRHARTQLDAERSARVFGLKAGFRPDELAGALALDCGIGTGRFADVAERHGAEVVGFDLSGSVEVAAALFRGRKIHVVQADLYHPPFRKEAFDVIYSIGVLNHSPDPERGFRTLVPLLKPGGSISISVYGESRRYWYMIEFWRRWTTRLQLETLYKLSRFLARRVYPIQNLPGLGFLSLLLPIPAEADLDWRILNTFNLYAPKYQSKHTYWELWQWFRTAGLEELEILPNPVAVRGRRPWRSEVSDRVYARNAP